MALSVSGNCPERWSQFLISARSFSELGNEVDLVEGGAGAAGAALAAAPAGAGACAAGAAAAADDDDVAAEASAKAAGFGTGDIRDKLADSGDSEDISSSLPPRAVAFFQVTSQPIKNWISMYKSL